MAAEEEDEAIGIPEWVLTFGDMMSLLLTFFIMLVSMSEISEEDKYEAIVDSLHRQFGDSTAPLSMIPGPMAPRNAVFAQVATRGRAMRLDIHSGGSKVKAPIGDNELVHDISDGPETKIGGVIMFEEGRAELTDPIREALLTLRLKLSGKPNLIRVRGHTTRRPLPVGSRFSDHDDLAYERCKIVQRFMVEEMNFDPLRFRLTPVGSRDPKNVDTDVKELQKNSRVEIFLLEKIYIDRTLEPDKNQKNRNN